MTRQLAQPPSLFFLPTWLKLVHPTLYSFSLKQSHSVSVSMETTFILKTLVTWQRYFSHTNKPESMFWYSSEYTWMISKLHKQLYSKLGPCFDWERTDNTELPHQEYFQWTVTWREQGVDKWGRFCLEHFFSDSSLQFVYLFTCLLKNSWS